MNIAQIVQKLSPGGLEVLALDLAQHVPNVSAHWLVSLEGTRDELVAAWPRLAPFKDQIIALNKPAGLSPRTALGLRAVLKDKQIDVVHSHHIGPLLYGGIAARLAGVKAHIHTEHDVWHLEQGRAAQIEKLALKIAKPTHIAITAQMATVLQQYFGQAVTVIPNGVDTQRFDLGDKAAARQALGLAPHGRQVIGTASRLQYVKGVDLLIEAAALLPTDKAPLVLIAGGGDEAQQLQAQAQALGLDETRMRFLGHIDSMPDFLAVLDLYVQPSRREGLPLAPLEALSAGVPVVMTQVGGANEVRAAGGHIVAAADAPALAEGISRGLAQSWDHAGLRAAMVKDYDIRAVATRYRAAYASALGVGA